jgi:hypothetical protein
MIPKPVPRPRFKKKLSVEIAPDVFMPVHVWCDVAGSFREGQQIADEAQRLAEEALRNFIKEIVNEQHLPREHDRRRSRPRS